MMFKLSDKLRLATVKRWHMVRTLREQSVAEHAALVQIIGLQILGDFSSGVYDELNKGMLMEWALYHDMPEVILGDIPTPFKQILEEKSPGLIENIEMEMFPEYAMIKEDTPELIKIIVKFADLFEAIKFISIEGHGEHADSVRKSLINNIKAMTLNVSKDESPSMKFLSDIFNLYIGCNFHG